MSADEAAFHRQIAAEPLNVVNALAYADWLEENGRPHAAAVVRHHAEWDQSPGYVFDMGRQSPYETGVREAHYIYDPDDPAAERWVGLTVHPHPWEGKLLRWWFRPASHREAGELLSGLRSEGVRLADSDAKGAADRHDDLRDYRARQDPDFPGPDINGGDDGPAPFARHRKAPRRYSREGEEAFHARIAESPHEAINALVLADYLDETGKPASARVVRAHATRRQDGGLHAGGYPRSGGPAFPGWYATALRDGNGVHVGLELVPVRGHSIRWWHPPVPLGEAKALLADLRDGEGVRLDDATDRAAGPRKMARRGSPRRYTLVTLSPGRRARSVHGETIYHHQIEHAETGESIGVISLVPRGEDLHVHWVGMHNTDSSHSPDFEEALGVEGVRALRRHLADAYPDQTHLTGNRISGFRRGRYNDPGVNPHVRIRLRPGGGKGVRMARATAAAFARRLGRRKLRFARPALHGTPGFNPPPHPAADPERVALRDQDPLWQYHRGQIDYGGREFPHQGWRELPSPYHVIHVLQSRPGEHHDGGTVSGRQGPPSPDPAVMPEGLERWGAAANLWRAAGAQGYDVPPGRPDLVLEWNRYNREPEDRPGFGVMNHWHDLNRDQHNALWEWGGTGRRPWYNALFPLQDLINLAAPHDSYRLLADAVLSGNRHAVGPLVDLLKRRDNPAGWWGGWTALHKAMTDRVGDLNPRTVAAHADAIANATAGSSADPGGHADLHYGARDAAAAGDFQPYWVLADHMEEHGLPTYAHLLRTELMNVSPHMRPQPKGRRRFSRQELGGLLANIREAPDQHLARGVLADYLDEHGHQAVAFLVRKAMEAPGTTHEYRRSTPVPDHQGSGRHYHVYLPGHDGSSRFVLGVAHHQDSTAESPLFLGAVGLTHDNIGDPGNENLDQLVKAYPRLTLDEARHLADLLRAERAGITPYYNADIRRRAKPDLHRWLLGEGFARPPRRRRRFARGNKDNPQTFLDALRRLRSSNQKTIRRVAAEVARSLALDPVHAKDALHDSSAGPAFPSVALAAYRSPDPATVRYAGAWLGLLTQSPGLAVFHVGRSGPDSVYKATLRGSGEDVRAKLDRAGFFSRVLMPTRDGFDVLLYDKGRRLRPRVAEFARAHGVVWEESLGRGEVLGGETPEAARDAYRKAIEKYEGGPVRQSRAGKPRRFAADPGVVAGLHARMIAEGQHGMTPLVLADHLEESGMPTVAAVIRRHAETYPYGHTWLRGSGVQSATGWELPPGGLVAQHMRLVVPMSYDFPGRVEGRPHRSPPDHDYIQVYQFPHGKIKDGQAFCWEVPVHKDRVDAVMRRLKAEGVKLPARQDRSPDDGVEPVPFARRKPRRFSLASEADFHRTIAAEPENDLHSLIYADYLEERGKPAHAEYIRRAVERSKPHVGYNPRRLMTWNYSISDPLQADRYGLNSDLGVPMPHATGDGRDELQWSLNSDPDSGHELIDLLRRVHAEGAVPYSQESDVTRLSRPGSPRRYAVADVTGDGSTGRGLVAGVARHVQASLRTTDRDAVIRHIGEAAFAHHVLADHLEESGDPRHLLVRRSAAGYDPADYFRTPWINVHERQLGIEPNSAGIVGVTLSGDPHRFPDGTPVHLVAYRHRETGEPLVGMDWAADPRTGRRFETLLTADEARSLFENLPDPAGLARLEAGLAQVGTHRPWGETFLFRRRSLTRRVAQAFAARSNS